VGMMFSKVHLLESHFVEEAQRGTGDEDRTRGQLPFVG